MRSGDRLKSHEASPRSSAGEGSFRRSSSGLSPESRSVSTPGSRKGVSPRSRLNASAAGSSPSSPKDFLQRLVNRESFNVSVRSWLQEKLSIEEDGYANCEPPFQLEELRQFDYAIEGVLFQQLLHMPISVSSEKAETCLAVEDFLYASVEGLWKAFWSSEEPLPLPVFVTGSHGFDLKQSQKDKRGVGGAMLTQCAAVVGKTTSDSGGDARWEHIGAFVLVNDDLGCSPEHSGLLPPPLDVVGDAVFFGLQMLLSRSYAGRKSAVRNNRDVAYVLLLDSRCGGVVRLKGDVSKLDTKSHKVYEAAARWVEDHARISISNVYQVWNRLGNADWRDVGALHLLLSLFACIEHFRGHPEKSIVEAASEHDSRLQHRQIERGLNSTRENGSNPVPIRRTPREIITEIEEDIEEPTNNTSAKEMERITLDPGAILWLEDSTRQHGFKIDEDLSDGQHSVYSASALDDSTKPLNNVYIGAHPSQLEPSWEDMSTWYQVQRQTRVLTVMKQRGVSENEYLPQLIISGRIVHPGACAKQSPSNRCDHPWCGTPALVTSPSGPTLQTVFQREGPFTPEDMLSLCHDTLSALQAVSAAGIHHGDINPNHVIRITGANANQTNRYAYILVEWGHAVLEDRDSPSISLRFSSTYALQEGKLCPASDAESLVYLLFFMSGGAIPEFESIESALQWRERCWGRRSIQQQLGDISAVLKAFADYVDSLCGTPYPVDYNIWLRRLYRALHGEDPGKRVEHNAYNLITPSRSEDRPECSGASGS